jgi:hypothetical protein
MAEPLGGRPEPGRGGTTVSGILQVLNVAIRAAFIVVGILLVGGYFRLKYVNSDFRILVGIIFILYGIFRIVTLTIKGRVKER